MHRFVGLPCVLSIVACGGLIAPETSAPQDSGTSATPRPTPTSSLAPPTAPSPSPSPTATSSPPSCANCVKTLYWAWDGGLVAYTDQHQLIDCSTYALTRVSSTADSQCVVQLGACSTANKQLAAVLAALGTADVKKAFSGKSRLYGYDPRAFDGAVLRIDANNTTVDVGSDCPPGTAKTCTPVPSGLRALADALNALAQYELDSGACKLK